MLNFNNYIERHGEFGVQAIVERLERYEGINNSITAVPLEDRWNALMHGHQTHRIAA